MFLKQSQNSRRNKDFINYLMIGITIFFVIITMSNSNALAQRCLIGIHIAETNTAGYTSRLEHAKQLGIRVVRVPTDWNALEPTQNSFDTEYLNEVKTRILETQNRGQRIVLMFSQAPPWANGNNEPPFPPKPAFYGAYANAFKKLYEEIISEDDQFDIHPSTIMALEVWNEPNVIEFWPTYPKREGTYVLINLDAAAEYADLLAQTYDVIKSAHTDAIILGGSLASADTEYLEALYSRWGGSSKFDALALHPYSGPDEHEGPHYSKAQYPDQCNEDDPLTPPWCFKQGIENIRATLDAHGDSSKQIWITEFGTGSSDSWGDAGSEEEQREHLKRSLDILHTWSLNQDAMKIPVAIIYRLVDELPDESGENDYFGLLRPDFSRKLAADLLASRLDSTGGITSSLWEEDPSRHSPIHVSTGAGSVLTVSIDLPSLNESWDIYFGIYAPALSPNEIFLITNNGDTVTTVSNGLVPYIAFSSGNIHQNVLSNISLSLLPEGDYYFYLLMSPANQPPLESFNLWWTTFSHE